MLVELESKGIAQDLLSVSMGQAAVMGARLDGLIPEDRVRYFLDNMDGDDDECKYEKAKEIYEILKGSLSKRL